MDLQRRLDRLEDAARNRPAPAAPFPIVTPESVARFRRALLERLGLDPGADLIAALRDPENWRRYEAWYREATPRPPADRTEAEASRRNENPYT